MIPALAEVVRNIKIVAEDDIYSAFVFVPNIIFEELSVCCILKQRVFWC